MVKNSANINKTNNHLSPQIIENKSIKTTLYDVRYHLCPHLREITLITMYTFGIKSEMCIWSIGL